METSLLSGLRKWQMIRGGLFPVILLLLTLASVRALPVRDLTGKVTDKKGEEVAKVPATTVVEALQGKILRSFFEGAFSNRPGDSLNRKHHILYRL